ncbi:MAG TPA: Maf family protein [Candidatus Acidoferrum sp.]|nr:Maf family protein [Candidatus Acidoferrum sp.]
MVLTLPIVLASASPRRRELLSGLGLAFEVAAADIDEEAVTAPTPQELVKELALQKARAVAKVRPDALVIGADTVVFKDGRIFGKPQDEADAADMLRALSGDIHTVATGVALVSPETEIADVVTAQVTFKTLTEGEIKRYIATGEPFDKAGGYGIQGRAAAMIREISGDYYTVVGLPVCRLGELLAEHFGIEVL